MSEYTIKGSQNPRGRPYSRKSRLGRVMDLRGWEHVYELAAKVHISPRQMTKYLACEEEIAPHHLVDLARELGVDNPNLLREGTEK